MSHMLSPTLELNFLRENKNMAQYLPKMLSDFSITEGGNKLSKYNWNSTHNLCSPKSSIFPSEYAALHSKRLFWETWGRIQVLPGPFTSREYQHQNINQIWSAQHFPYMSHLILTTLKCASFYRWEKKVQVRLPTSVTAKWSKPMHLITALYRLPERRYNPELKAVARDQNAGLRQSGQEVTMGGGFLGVYFIVRLHDSHIGSHTYQILNTF